MKKGIIVLLITVLAAGFVFADFSGDAYIQFNADLDDKNYGFANGTDFGFSFKLDEEVAKVEGESPIHAVVEATAKLIVDDAYGANGTSIYSSNDGCTAIGLVLNLKTAKIAGDNWYVSILGANSSAYNYASASAFTVASFSGKDNFGNKYYNKYYGASYSVSYAKAPGVTVGYDGFTASFGFNHVEETGTAFSATVETKEFAFSDDMIKVQAAVEASKKADKDTNVGASAKFAFAKDQISAKAVADFGFEGIGGEDDVKVQFDASLAAAYDFVSATAYFFKGDALAKTYKELYLEATVAADLNAFDVPVTVSVAATNLIDKSEAGIGLSASVKYAADAITAGAKFGLSGLGIEDGTTWSAKAYGIYAAENFTAGADVQYSSKAKAVSFGAFAESSAIIDGVTIGLNYGLPVATAMYYGGAYCVSNYYNNNSFAEETTVGMLGAYCLIAF